MLPFIAASPVSAAVPATTLPPLLPPKAWVLVDADTANVLDAGNDHTPLPPASLTKVITALSVVDSLAPGLTDVPVSARAAAMPAAKISMKQGEVWTLDDTLHALLLSSANDAAVALAERAGGTVEGFQRTFAATAATLGFADNPVLNDPAGLDGPQGVEGGNLVSARDLAIATRALLSQPILAAIVATPIYRFTGPDGFHHRLTNHNFFFLSTYAGGIGVKTGYTRRAGHCLIAAARRDGRTMLAVVLNSGNPTQAAKQLLDKGFATRVAGEPTADQLPPLRLDGAGGPVGLPPAGSGGGASRQVNSANPPPTALAGPTARRAGATGSYHSIWSSWPGQLAVGVLALIGLLRLRVLMRGPPRPPVPQRR